MDDYDCLEDFQDSRYLLSDSYEKVCAAAERELKVHNGHFEAKKDSFEGWIDEHDCRLFLLQISRDKRYLSDAEATVKESIAIPKETAPAPGKVGVRLRVWDSDVWHDFQFLKGR